MKYVYDGRERFYTVVDTARNPLLAIPSLFRSPKGLFPDLMSRDWNGKKTIHEILSERPAHSRSKNTPHHLLGLIT